MEKLTAKEAKEYLIKNNDGLRGYIERLNSELSKINPKLDFVVKGYETVKNAEHEVKVVETAIQALTLLEKQEQGCDECQQYPSFFNYCPNCGRKLTKEEESEVEK